MEKTFFRKLVLSFTVAAILIPAVAFADSASYTIAPAHPMDNASWLVYQIKPGDSLQDEVIVKNLSDKTITLSLYPADKEEQVTPQGSQETQGFALKSKESISETIGKWVTISKPSVTLAPKSEEKIGVTLTVPSGTTEKEYQGGILAELFPETVASVPGKSTNSISVGTRVGVRMYATVSSTAVTSNPMAPTKVASDNTSATSTATSQTNNLFTPINIIIALLILMVIGIIVRSFSAKGGKSNREKK